MKNRESIEDATKTSVLKATCKSLIKLIVLPEKSEQEMNLPRHGVAKKFNIAERRREDGRCLLYVYYIWDPYSGGIHFRSNSKLR